LRKGIGSTLPAGTASAGSGKAIVTI
jgi:hypothetical protein